MDGHGRYHDYTSPEMKVAPGRSSEQERDAIEGIPAALVTTRGEKKEIDPTQGGDYGAQEKYCIDQPVVSGLFRYSNLFCHGSTSSGKFLILRTLPAAYEEVVKMR